MVDERTIRVLLVDDHAVVRAGYRHFLATRADLQVVGEAATAAAGYRLALQCRPDVAVIDLSLPGTSGLALIERLSRRLPTTRSLAFTMHEEPEIRRRALDQGATGYLCKRCLPAELATAIETVASGRRYPLTVEPAHQDPAAPARLERLSPREFEIFRQLAEGRRTGQIADELQISQKTVANYSLSIRAKLGVRSTAALARAAIAAGVLPMMPG